MSHRDIQFIEGLSISGSEVARILDISRQSVSRGLNSESDYLDQRKLLKITEVAPKVFGVEEEHIRRLIDHFYPHYKADIRRIALSGEIKLSIDSDMYLSCMRLPYYMSVYGKQFSELSAYLKAMSERKLYFAFPDPESLRYSRERVINWIGDERAVQQAHVIICPAIEIFPFSVSGTDGKRPIVYFCESDGFKAQNEVNSRWIVSFIRKFIREHEPLIKKLRPES